MIGSFSIGARGKGRELSRFHTGHNGIVVNFYLSGPRIGDMVTIGLDPAAARRLASELNALADRVDKMNRNPTG